MTKWQFAHFILIKCVHFIIFKMSFCICNVCNCKMAYCHLRYLYINLYQLCEYLLYLLYSLLYGLSHFWTHKKLYLPNFREKFVRLSHFCTICSTRYKILYDRQDTIFVCAYKSLNSVEIFSMYRNQFSSLTFEKGPFMSTFIVSFILQSMR